MKRFLIINADDFGLNSEVNAAILRAHREGILTSASLMVGEPGFEEAVEIARANPSLGVGLHVTTTLDRPTLPPSDIPHIVNRAGRLEANPLMAGLRYGLSKHAQRDIRREMEAQFARFAATGLPWSHVDGHQHFHMHSKIFGHLVDLCDRYGVHRIRVPVENLRPHLQSGGDGLSAVTLGVLVLNRFCRRNLKRLLSRKTLGGKPVFLCDRVYGSFQTSNMHRDYTLRLLDRLEGVTNEIYFHPGTGYARKLPADQQVGTVRDVEFHALLAPEVKVKMEALGFCRGTYAEVEAWSRKE